MRTTRYEAIELRPGLEWGVVRTESEGSRVVREQLLLRLQSQALALRIAESMGYAHGVATRARAAAPGR